MSTSPADACDRREFDFTARDFERTRTLIYAHSGIALSDAKTNLVYSRLGKRLRLHKLTRFGDYLDRVESDPREFEAFVNALTTNLTAFYREVQHFKALASYVTRRGRPRGLRVWCAAASTGEEPYSLAMTLADAYGTYPPPVRLAATDLDTNVLAVGAAGVYPLDRLDSVPDVQRKRYFLRGVGPHLGEVRARPELRAMIEFRQLNLCGPDWDVPAALDVIFARNVLIYFDRKTQLRILERFYDRLGDDAMLVTGHSEILFYATHLFAQIGKTIYRPVR